MCVLLVLCRHYSIPIIPDLPGLSRFQGTVIHSHSYRHPEDFSDQRVFCLGAAASGQDIALDIASQAQKVLLGMTFRCISQCLGVLSNLCILTYVMLDIDVHIICSYY